MELDQGVPYYEGGRILHDRPYYTTGLPPQHKEGKQLRGHLWLQHKINILDGSTDITQAKPRYFISNLSVAPYLRYGELLLRTVQLDLQ